MSTQQLPSEPAAPSRSAAGFEATKPTAVSATSPTAHGHNVQASQGTARPEAEGPSKKRDTTAWIALLGTIAAALIGGVTAVKVAQIGHSPGSSPAPDPTTVSSTIPAPAPTAPGPAIVSNTIPPLAPTSAAANGVSYECTGSAPNGIEILYGSDGGETGPSNLPFSVSEGSLDTGAQLYEIVATLRKGVGGWVTCTLSLTAAGHTVTDTQTATGSGNKAQPIISYDDGQWGVND